MKVTIFNFNLFGINTYLLEDPETKCCAVVDPGMSDEQEVKVLDDYIKRNNLKLTHVINTHLHLDHAAGNNYLKLKYDVPVFANEKDKKLGDMMQQQAMMFGLPMKFDNLDITQFLIDGETIKIGNDTLLVIGVPGHSQGSIALYDEKDGYVIAGDALFRGSIGRTDLPGGNYHQLIDNIKNKLLKLPDSTVVYPGHGPSTTIGEEKQSNPFLI